MDFFFFKTGSWWVYEQENTGKRDSVYVGYHNIGTDNAVAGKRNCGCGKGKCVQIANTSFFNDKYKDKSLYGYTIMSLLEEGEYDIGEGGKVYNNPSGYRITYHNNMYDKESPSYGTYEDMPSVEVNGKTYTDILHLYYSNQDNIGDWLHEAWYARNIYLIRFRLYDGTTWNLVKYHIVK